MADMAEANTAFAREVILGAAEAIKNAPEGDIHVIHALSQARDRFLEKETSQHRRARTYSYGNLMQGLRLHIVEQEGVSADSFTPLAEWEQQHDSRSLAEKLKQAAESIVSTVEEQTKSEGWLGKLNGKELDEYILMQRAITFLREQGLMVEIDWAGRDPNSPIDFHGKVDGEDWSFELKQLREDPKGYHRKIGHPNDPRPMAEQWASLAAPAPQIPDGPDSLRKNLNRLVENASTAAKLEAARGEKYCLIIHNRQFLFVDDWRRTDWPSLERFDAVMILHEGTMPFAQGWEVIPPQAFGRAVKSGTLEHLARMAESLLRQADNPEILRAAWDELKERSITDEDIQKALQEVRGIG